MAWPFKSDGGGFNSHVQRMGVYHYATNLADSKYIFTGVACSSNFPAIGHDILDFRVRELGVSGGPSDA